MSIWFHELSVETLEKLGGGIDRHLGIEFTDFGPDFIRGTMPVEARLRFDTGRLGSNLAGRIPAFTSLRV